MRGRKEEKKENKNNEEGIYRRRKTKKKKDNLEFRLYEAMKYINLIQICERCPPGMFIIK